MGLLERANTRPIRKNTLRDFKNSPHLRTCVPLVCGKAARGYTMSRLAYHSSGVLDGLMRLIPPRPVTVW